MAQKTIRLCSGIKEPAEKKKAKKKGKGNAKEK